MKQLKAFIIQFREWDERRKFGCEFYDFFNHIVCHDNIYIIMPVFYTRSHFVCRFSDIACLGPSFVSPPPTGILKSYKGGYIYARIRNNEHNRNLWQ